MRKLYNAGRKPDPRTSGAPGVSEGRPARWIRPPRRPRFETSHPAAAEPTSQGLRAIVILRAQKRVANQ